tara:strand:+ start:50785 stop:50961 length:177 start_codon:yes stop_codon:yes gene_type:complete
MSIYLKKLYSLMTKSSLADLEKELGWTEENLEREDRINKVRDELTRLPRDGKSHSKLP